MTATEELTEINLGTGAYTFPEAIRILRSVGDDVTSRQLHYWIDKGLARPVNLTEDGRSFPVLSFDDLVSLEVVRRFKELGSTIQRVTRFDRVLREHFPELSRPFAYQIFLTDGQNIWAQIDNDPESVVELVGQRPRQCAWTRAVKTFAREFRWSNDHPARAKGWELSPWVDIDPEIQFGAPVVRGTRVPVRTIEANLRAGRPEEVAEWYDLPLEAVLGVRDYLALA